MLTKLPLETKSEHQEKKPEKTRTMTGWVCNRKVAGQSSISTYLPSADFIWEREENMGTV